MPIKRLNPRNQISHLAIEGLAIESYTYSLEDGVPQVGGADELLPTETYCYVLDHQQEGTEATEGED
jgi:hypothetical protein